MTVGAPASPLLRLLDRQGFVVLDGGLATALQMTGHALDDELWSAKLLLEAPDAIRAVHCAFLEAGADCISTASYQATLPGFERLGIDRDAGAALLRYSVELAVEAREAFWAAAGGPPGRAEPLVAASVGPYGAFLADGSEYDGRYGLDRSALADFHLPRLEVLADTAADVLAIETIPSGVEVEALVELLGQVRHPGAWLSFCCRDGAALWDGTPVEEAARLCSAAAGVVAVGVNCTVPSHVVGLLRKVRAATDLPILAYPNSGEAYDAATGAWSGATPGATWVERVPEWFRAGARIIGGCCRVGPEEIAGVRRMLAATVRERQEEERRDAL